jgi:putative endonuclease
MTDNLVARVWQHRESVVPGFTKQYNIKILVWYELHDTREAAIVRERQIKRWNRSWKLQMIEIANPTWRDLYQEIVL